MELYNEHREALQRSQEMLQNLIRTRASRQASRSGRGGEREATVLESRGHRGLRQRRELELSSQHGADRREVAGDKGMEAREEPRSWDPWAQVPPSRSTRRERPPERDDHYDRGNPRTQDLGGHRSRPTRRTGTGLPRLEIPVAGFSHGRARSSPPPGADPYEPYGRFFGQEASPRVGARRPGHWEGQGGGHYDFDDVPNFQGQDLFGEQAPAAFYRSLPEGWREPPRGHGALSFNHLSALQRSGYMPTFNGKIENYHGFKMHFLVAVHRLPLPILAKHMALRGVLEKTPELETFVGTVEPGLDGYAAMIWELEDRYGGRERLLHRHASNIKFLPTVSEDNLSTLEKFLSSVHAYHTALNNDTEIGSYHHFNELYYKLEHQLRIKYRTYCRTVRVSSAEESSAFTLIDWLKNVIMLPLRMDPRRAFRPDRARVQMPGARQEPPRRAWDATRGVLAGVTCSGLSRIKHLKAKDM